MPKHSLLADLVDIQDQLKRDLNTDQDALNARDRDIGLSGNFKGLNSRGGTPHKLRQWIAALRRRDPDAYRGHQAQKSVSVLILCMWSFGVLVGWALTHTVLAYDGSQPINIIHCILILIATQVFTLLLLVALSVFGLSAILGALSILNPASIIVKLAGMLHPQWAQTLRRLLSPQTSTDLAQLHQPLLVYLSQYFTIGLNLGMIAALLYLVTTSDLAFGWNTTLDIDSAMAYQWFKGLGILWETLLPSAIPTEQLVESSRYYRLEGALKDNFAPAEVLGTWWLYLLVGIVIYGLLPRLVTLLISGSLYDRVIHNTIGASPGAHQVVLRLASPLVRTQSMEDEIRTNDNIAKPALRARQYAYPLPSVMIEWAATSELNPARPPTTSNRQSWLNIGDKALADIGISPVSYFSAGGYQSIDQDQQLVAHIVELKPQGVTILVKGWESPTLEFVDFVDDLGQKLVDKTTLIVLLASVDQVPISNTQIQSWESMFDQNAAFSPYIEHL